MNIIKLSKKSILVSLFFFCLNNTFTLTQGKELSNAELNAQKRNCQLLTHEQLYKVKGWKLLESFINGTFGDPWESILMQHPTDLTSTNIAYLCSTTTHNLNMGKIKRSSCNKVQSSVEGKSNQDGEFIAVIKSGHEISVSLAFENEKEFKEGETIKLYGSGQVTPGVSAGGHIKIDIEQTVVNKKGNQTESKVHNAIDHTIEFHSPSGKKCSAVSTIEVCTFDYEASANVSIEGTIWIQYKNPQKGHDLWAIKLDSILPLHDRILQIPLKMNVRTRSYGQFHAECNCFPKACPNHHQNQTHDTPEDILRLYSKEDYIKPSEQIKNDD